MIKAIALDDEPLALEVLQQLCAEIPGLELAAVFTKATEALAMLRHHKVDLLFLDINMPGVSGLNFYQSLQDPPLLILTTAYQEYALNAFELNAVDYLLKPFTGQRLQQAVSKVQAKLDAAPKGREAQDLWLKSDAGHIKIAFDAILWVESLDNYVKIHLTDEPAKLVRMTMKAIGEALPQAKFIRVHRSYLVAINKIRQISASEVTIGSVKIAIGALYKKAVLDLINRKL